MRTLTLLLLSTLATTPAWATRSQVRGGVGVGSDLGERPEDLRFHVQGEITPLYGGLVSVGIVLPFTVAGSNADGFGFDVSRTVFEFVPSARVRFFDDGIARPYADLGFGVSHTVTDVDGWFGRTDVRTGWMHRAVLGFEVGLPGDGFFAAFEPAILNVYGSSNSARARYAAAIGFGARF